MVSVVAGPIYTSAILVKRVCRKSSNGVYHAIHDVGRRAFSTTDRGSTRRAHRAALATSGPLYTRVGQGETVVVGRTCASRGPRSSALVASDGRATARRGAARLVRRATVADFDG